jgi:hypothetical protein
MKQYDLFGNEIPQLKKIEKDLIETSICNLFKDISLDDLVRLITNELDACVEYFQLSNGEKTCQNLSLLFNPHRLQIPTKKSKNSFYDSLKDENFRKGLARAICFVHNKGVRNNLLLRAIEIGINGVGFANEFFPYYSRDLLTEFGVLNSDKVLDPCGGWGGRMIGTSVVCNHYECYEPSTKTYNGLIRLGNWIQQFNKDFRFIVHKLPFEDSQLDDESFDFALTSPPYYDTEDYTDELSNSKNRYKTFDEWCDGFYLPMIQKTMDALKKGKCFVLNIGSRVYPLNKVLLSNFSGKYEIRKHRDLMSGCTAKGMRHNSESEGETFYIIYK